MWTLFYNNNSIATMADNIVEFNNNDDDLFMEMSLSHNQTDISINFNDDDQAFMEIDLPGSQRKLYNPEAKITIQFIIS